MFSAEPTAGELIMTSNVTPIDQTVRVGAGLFLLASPLLELHTYPFNLLGIVLMVTGIAGYCPLYSAFRSLLPREQVKYARARASHGGAK
jgi:hypothetical protein